MIVKHEFQCKICPTKKTTEYAIGVSDRGGPVIVTPLGWLYVESNGYYCPRHVVSIVYVEGKIVKIDCGEDG